MPPRRSMPLVAIEQRVRTTLRIKNKTGQPAPHDDDDDDDAHFLRQPTCSAARPPPSDRNLPQLRFERG